MTGKKEDILAAFFRNEKGATAIEYALIAVAMALMLLVVLPVFTDQTREVYRVINEDIMRETQGW